MATAADSVRSSRVQSTVHSFRSALKGRTFFLGAAFLGGILIFLSEPLNSPIWFGVIGPISIMIVYIILGLNDVMEVADNESFADSIYYLGFVLTLVSLAAALVYLRNETTELGPLVSKFGLALLTTIIGLCVRVALVNFKVASSQARRSMDERLSRSVERFSDDLELTCEKMELLLNGSLDQVTTTATLVKEATAEATKAITTATVQSSAHMTALYEKNGSHWDATITKLTSDLEELIQLSTDSAIENVKAFHKKVERETEEFEIPKDAFSKKLEPALIELSTSMGKGATEITINMEKLVVASAGHEKVRQQFEDLGEALEMGSDTLTSLRERATELSESYSDLQGLSDQLEKFHSELTETTQSAEKLDSALGQSHQTITKGAKSSQAHLIAMSGQLEEIVAIGRKQSEVMSQLIQKISTDAENGQLALELVQKNLIESSRVIVDTLNS